MNASELEGTVLDWAVAKCEGVLGVDMGTCRGCHHLEERGISDGSEYRCWLGDLNWCDGGFNSDDPFGDGISVEYGTHQDCPLKNSTKTEAYSTSWNEGGPIIERMQKEQGLVQQYLGGKFIASLDTPQKFFYGETLLIAAMRCYVASKLGDEVAIPEELK